jgi:hypothetical protein
LISAVLSFSIKEKKEDNQSKKFFGWGDRKIQVFACYSHPDY